MTSSDAAGIATLNTDYLLEATMVDKFKGWNARLEGGPKTYVRTRGNLSPALVDVGWRQRGGEEKKGSMLARLCRRS